MTLPSGWENFISVRGPVRSGGDESFVLQLVAGYENQLDQYWGFSKTITVYEFAKDHDPKEVVKKFYRGFATDLKNAAQAADTTFTDVTASEGVVFAMGDTTYAVDMHPQVQAPMLNDEWEGMVLPDTVPYNEYISN